MRDDELTELRARVDCRTVLERAGWTLDEQESTRGAAKYRHGAGRIVIVTHEGRGLKLLTQLKILATTQNLRV